MRSRTTLFMVLCLVACAALFVADASAQQCVQNPDGSFTCPVLAPPLPAAVAAVAVPAATQESAVSAADRLTLRERRKLGLTFGNCLRAARKLKANGTLSDDPDIASGQIAAEIAGENPQAYGEVGVDWDAILAFIERLIPLIMQLIEMFGGLAHGCSPTLMLAA